MLSRLVDVRCPACATTHGTPKLLGRADATAIVELKCPTCKQIVRFDRGRVQLLGRAPAPPLVSRAG